MRWTNACVVLACVVLGACGGEDKKPNSAQGGSTSSGGSSNSGGSTSSGGSGTGGASDGTTGDGGASTIPPVTIDTNLSASVTQTIDAAADAGLRLTSFVYLQDTQDLGLGYYTQWFGTVKHYGSTPVCLTQVNFVMKDSLGATLFDDGSYVYAIQHAVSDKVYSCLSQGQEGVIWANDFAISPTLPSRVATVEVSFVPLLEAGAVPDPQAPTLSNVSAVDRYGTGDELMSGTLTNGSRAIEFPQVYFFLVGTDGLLKDMIDDIYGTGDGTLAASSTWNFETLTTDGAILPGYRTIVDYSLPNALSGDADPALVSRAVQAASSQREASKRAQLRR